MTEILREPLSDAVERTRREGENIVTNDWQIEKVRGELSKLALGLGAISIGREVAMTLFDSTPTKVITNGNHEHGVLFRKGERGKGPLFTASKLPPDPGAVPKLHTHPTPEWIISTGQGLESVIKTPDGREQIPINPFKLLETKAGTPHSVVNTGPRDVYFLCFRVSITE